MIFDDTKTAGAKTSGFTPAVLITGFAAGLLNGVFGSGGGIALVLAMKKSGGACVKEQARRHATSVAVVLVLSVCSCVAFYLRRSLDAASALTFLPAGLLGAGLGAKKLKNIAPAKLQLLFKVITAAGGAVSLLGLPPLKLDGNFFIHNAAAFLAGAAAAMGLGGGFILMLYLTIFAGVPQGAAGGINLVFFLPISAVSTFINLRGGMVEKKMLYPLSVSGTAGAVCGSVLMFLLAPSSGVLRRVFGALLIASVFL